MDDAVKLEALLEHADWVRRLAHSLVADPARAEDIAQETWLRALEAPPRHSKNPRGWLGAVVRNLARRSARSQLRREARESEAARVEALPEAAELVEQAELQRQIAALVIGLDEPYRHTLLLRYYQGFAAESIASRTGVPLNTVRTRLQRGLALLREQLDRRFGDRGTWCAALAPLLRAPLTTTAMVQGSSVLSMGALIMTAKSKWLGLASVAFLGLWWLWPREAALQSGGEIARAPSAPSLQAPDIPRAASERPPAGARVPTETIPAARTEPPALPRLVSVLRGRCVDLAGQPMAGLEIEWIDEREARIVDNQLWIGDTGMELTPELRAELLDEELARLLHPEFVHVAHGVAEALRGERYRRPSVRTQIDGTFRIEQESAGGRIDLVRSDLWMLESVHVAEFPETLHPIAPCIAFAGSVVDSEQRPIAGASLRWELSIEGVRDFPYVVENSAYNQGLATSDARGLFEFKRVPVAAGGRLSVAKSGYATLGLSLPDRSEQDRILVLQREPEEPERYIAGRVVHRDGRPGAGAHVAFGQDSDTADSGGAFRIRLTVSPSEGTPLTAFVKGARPAALLGFDEQVTARNCAIDDALLVLDETLPPIRGRVLDAAGAPCANWQVSLVGAQPLGTSNWTLEGMAGEDGAKKATDREGRFRFGGLLDHPYRVRAWTTETMVSVESDLVPPGTEDLVVRIPADATLERIVGRVVSRRGLPIDGATISIGLVVSSLGNGFTSTWREAARADATGRFEMRGVPRRGCMIGASDKRIRSHSITFDETMAGRELLLEVDLDLRFRVEPRKAGEFDRFWIQDRSGARLDAQIHLLHAEVMDGEVHMRDGAFPLCSTSEAAETLVLLLGKTEIRRAPLVLHPGEITVIAP